MNIAVNPKDALGAAKPSVTKIPSAALIQVARALADDSKPSLCRIPAAGIIHCSRAMMNGAVKYGPYNWRDKRIVSSIYIDAMWRHGLSWFDGEELASDSGVHHLGHLMASGAILLDAQAVGSLEDDRPIKGNAAALLGEFKMINEVMQTKQVSAAACMDDIMGFLMSWFDGEETHVVTGASNIAHAVGTAAMLLDAQVAGTLVDDRPTPGAASDLIVQFTTIVAPMPAPIEIPAGTVAVARGAAADEEEAADAA